MLAWGRRHFAVYPWRTDRDPWLTLIAQILLQRTRASQVLGTYELFRSRYRTPAALLRSSRRDLRQVTKHIGLHSRAETVVRVARSFELGLSAEDDVREITGVAPYTVAAWLSLHRNPRAVI